MAYGSGSNGQYFKGLMTKEQLEGISLPFRLISPALQVLIFLSTLVFGVVNFLYVRSDTQFKENLKLQFEYIKGGQREIKSEVEKISSITEVNRSLIYSVAKESEEERKNIISDYQDWKRESETRLTWIETKLRRLR